MVDSAQWLGPECETKIEDKKRLEHLTTRHTKVATQTITTKALGRNAFCPENQTKKPKMGAGAQKHAPLVKKRTQDRITTLLADAFLFFSSVAADIAVRLGPNIGITESINQK